MTSGMRRRVATFVLFLITVSVLSGGVWRYAYLQGLDQLRARGQADLSLVSDRLVGQLQRYRDLAVFLADHPQVAQVLDRRPAVEAQAFLQEVADKTTALDVQVLDRSGDVIVAALGAEAVRVPRADQRFVQRALRGALGWGHGPAAPLTDRAYFHAAPVFAPDGQVRGAVVVSTDLNGIDYDWRGSNPAAFFTDTDGVVQIANRSELLFWARPRAAQGLVPPDGAALDFAVSDVRGHEIWHMGWGPYLPDAALHLTRALPVVGMTGEVLLDIEGAQRLARAQAAAVAALCLAFGALLFLATERRRALSEANAALERQVAKRTAALNASNTELRREATEREEAQAALRRAQADLVQAGKLSALGQMSAGISHELNQPLMAIRQFAENGALFLDRGKTDTARANLSRIEELSGRMGRIIRNLRAFARQESEPARRVDVAQVIATALEMTEARLAKDAITLHWTAPDTPVPALAGEVRLVQVLVNLITNAADAMAGTERRELTLSVTDTPRPTIRVADTGPGIAQPERIFDPFYSTKEVGASEGMGLGLSISYGMVQSFGGAIQGRNREDGGAVFTVELEPVPGERAA